MLREVSHTFAVRSRRRSQRRPLQLLKLCVRPAVKEIGCAPKAQRLQTQVCIAPTTTEQHLGRACLEGCTVNGRLLANTKELKAEDHHHVVTVRIQSKGGDLDQNKHVPSISVASSETLHRASLVRSVAAQAPALAPMPVFPVQKIFRVQADVSRQFMKVEGLARSSLEKAECLSHMQERTASGMQDGRIVLSKRDWFELYGLHKVATSGTCKETPPPWWTHKPRWKWQAGCPPFSNPPIAELDCCTHP